VGKGTTNEAGKQKMTRLATIDRDMEFTEPPPAWDSEWVRWRLVEAYRIEQRLPGASRRTQRGYWPEHAYEFSDTVGWDEARREQVVKDWAHARNGAVYSVEVTRMDEAQDWLSVELKDHQVERTCLAAWAACVAYKHSLRSLMLRKRWSRTTFYRRVLFGSERIAAMLRSSNVEVR
jgi:hypothetical protein